MVFIERVKEISFFFLASFCALIFSPIWTFFWIWKTIVKSLIYILYSELDLTFLSVADSYMYGLEGRDDFCLNPKICVVGILVLEGHLGQDEVRTKFQKEVIEGSRTFGRLRKRIFKKFGYVFFGCDKSFDIANHIYEVKLPLNRESLQDFVVQRYRAPFQPDSPMWEILLIQKYNGQNKTLLLIRMHHLVMDGFSAIHFLKACATEIPESEILIPAEIQKSTEMPKSAQLTEISVQIPKLTRTEPRTELTDSIPVPSTTLVQRLGDVYTGTIAVPWKYILEQRSHKKLPHLPNFEKQQHQPFHALGVKIPLEKFKTLKATRNVSFTEAILFATSDALNETCKPIRSQDSLPMKLTFPLPTTGKTIGNNFYLPEVNLPLGSMTLEERLQRSDAKMNFD